MKKFQLLSYLFGIAILLSSCASQHRLELVGHYKPNHKAVKNQASAPDSHSDEMMTTLPSQNDNEPVASTNETTPDLKLLHPALQSLAPQMVFTEKEEKKLDKKLEKVKVKLEKRATQIGKQIQQSDLFSNKKEKRFHFLLTGDPLLCAIISIFIPPLGVALYEEGITTHFWIDLILTILGWLPGVIYALVIIL